VSDLQRDPTVAERLPPVAPTAPLPPAILGWLLALVGWTAVLCFYDLGGGARFEPIDCWVAQTAREMQEAGNWLVPRFSGEVRMQKSPGPYWAVMLTSLIRGQPVDEISARIPNGLMALLLVVTVFWLTRRMAGDRAALFAGFATSSSVLVLWWSHRGASDLGLAAFCALSLACIWIGSECEPPGRRRVALWLLGYFAAGLGMLYKMPMPLVVVGLPAVCYVLLRRRWSILASGWHLVGLVLFVLPWLPWVIGVTLAEGTALAKWKVEFLDRYTGDLPNVEGQNNWSFLFTYFGPTLLYCLPFTLSLPLAFVRAFRRQAGVIRNGTLFMFIWFASLFVFFTSSTGKEWRYFLPAVPPLFVLLGIELSVFFHPQRTFRPRLDRAGAIAVWILAPLTLAALGVFAVPFWWRQRGQAELQGLYTAADVGQAYIVTALLLVAGLSLAAWLYVRRREQASFATLVVMMWVVWFWAWPKVMPLVMSQRPFVDFAKQLADAHCVPIDDRQYLRQVGSQDSRITWYSDVRFPRLIDQLELLREQGFKRSHEYELRRYLDEMVSRLKGDQPILLVSTLQNFLLFVLAAPDELAKTGQKLPPMHLWLQSRYGREDTQFILFGNKPPPFTEPELRVSDKIRAKLRGHWPVTLRPGGGG
jgi:4-amino-4-deoxy-L-arabinose transferase-like glycosyltransferase